MDKGDHKKISFGFSKLSRKTNLIQKPVVEQKKIELIDCVEDQSIKIVGGEENKEIAPLVIPMRNPNKKLLNLEAIVKNDFKDDFEDDKPVVKTEEVTEELKPDENLSLDELAARELLKDLKNGQVKKEITKVISVPVTDKVVFEGEKESTLEDYDDIPVKDFGLAVLRGMGWKDGEGIGKNSKVVQTTQPTLRPKGMGLGADRIAKQNVDAKPAVDKEGKALACVKGAYIKIIAGYHKGFYGQIMGFDEESGRFIIKTALNNLNLSLNEFLVTPVTKDDYNKNSKVINNEKYEEYLKKKNIKKEKSRSPSRSPEGPRIPGTVVKKENNHDLSDEEKNQNTEDTKIIPDVDIKTEINSPDKDKTEHQQNSLNQSDHNSSSRDRTADQRSASYSKSERLSYPNNRDSTDRSRSSKQQERSDNNRRHRSVSREKYNRNSERSDNRRESRDSSNDRRYSRTNRNVDGSYNRHRHSSRDDDEWRSEGHSRTEQSRRNKYEDSHNEAADTKYSDRSNSRQSRTSRKSNNPDKKTRDRTESKSDSDDGGNTPVASSSRRLDKSVHRKHKHLDDSDGDSKHSSKHSKHRNADKAHKNKSSDSSDESSEKDSKKKKRKSKRKHSMSDSSDDSDNSSSSEDRKKHRKRKSKKKESDSSGDEKQKKCKKRDRSKTRKHKNKKKEKHRKRN